MQANKNIKKKKKEILEQISMTVNEFWHYIIILILYSYKFNRKKKHEIYPSYYILLLKACLSFSQNYRIKCRICFANNIGSLNKSFIKFK